MTPRAPSPSTVAAPGAAVPGKFSELILEFAQPLLGQGAPSDPGILRAVLVVAVLCWNAGALELAGDPKYRDIVGTLLAMVPAEDHALLEQLIATRKTRYRAIPFLLDVEVTENLPQHAHIEARAYLTQRPSASSTRPNNGGWSSTPLTQSAPGGMTPFDTVFRDVASEETRSWTVVDERSLPRGSYLLRELYCTELDCGRAPRRSTTRSSRRVILDFQTSASSSLTR